MINIPIDYPTSLLILTMVDWGQSIAAFEEASAMDRQHTKFRNSPVMTGGSIPLMLFKPVHWMLGRQLIHSPISQYFGANRSQGDNFLFFVAFDYRALIHVNGGCFKAAIQ